MSVKYDEYFTKASQKYDIDKDLLIAVAKTESNLNPNAVSSAGAVGIMQLMPGTARELGVTNSYDPEENIMGGAKYLSQLLTEFDGNAELALSAYNAGASRVKQNGGVLSYTEEYVNKVMSNYESGTPTTETVTNSGGNSLVWWGDIVRVVLVLLIIASGVILIAVALNSAGVPFSKESLVKSAVKGATNDK